MQLLLPSDYLTGHSLSAASLSTVTVTLSDKTTVQGNKPFTDSARALMGNKVHIAQNRIVWWYFDHFLSLHADVTGSTSKLLVYMLLRAHIIFLFFRTVRKMKGE